MCSFELRVNTWVSSTYPIFVPKQRQESMKQIRAMASLLRFNEEEWLRILKMMKAEWIEQKQSDYSNLRSDSELIKYLKKSRKELHDAGLKKLRESKEADHLERLRTVDEWRYGLLSVSPSSPIQFHQFWFKKFQNCKSSLLSRSSRLQSLRLRSRKSHQFKSSEEERLCKYASRHRKLQSPNCLSRN